MSMTERKYFYDEVTIDKNVELDYLTTRLKDLDLETVDLFTVDNVTEFRPDLISLKCYGTYHLGWLIAEHNGFMDPVNDFYSGRSIKIPGITDYYQFYNRNSRKV